MNVKRMAAAVSAVIMAAGTVCYFSEVPETAFSASDDYYYHYDMESQTDSFAGRGSRNRNASASCKRICLQDAEALRFLLQRMVTGKAKLLNVPDVLRNGTVFSFRLMTRS